MTYSIGAGGTGTIGANGSNTVWGTITLLGGGATGFWGSRGVGSGTTGYDAPMPPIYGSSNTSNQFHGKGFRIGDTSYGAGGVSGADADGTAGCILLEWWETE